MATARVGSVYAEIRARLDKFEREAPGFFERVRDGWQGIRGFG